MPPSGSTLATPAESSKRLSASTSFIGRASQPLRSHRTG
jgi:hypothetical protein